MRAKGEGSVIRLKNGRWQAKIKVDGKVKSRNAQTKAEAVRLLQELKRPAEKPADARTVAEEMMSARKGYAPATEKRLWSTLRTYVIPRVDERGWDGLSGEWLSTLLTSRSTSTVKKVRDASVMLMSAAGVERRLEMPRIRESKRVVIYTREELGRFEDEALRKNAGGGYVHRYGLALMILLHTGLRAGELSALKRDDVGEDIFVRATWANGKIQDHPKSGASIRRVPLSDKARDLVSEAERVYHGEYLISTVSGKPVNPIRLDKAFDKIIENAEIPKYRGSACHILRDSFASYLYDSCGDLLTVSRILGHSSVRVTEKYYLAVTDAKKVNAVQNLRF